MSRDKAWSVRGVPVEGEISGLRFARESFVAGYKNGKVIAPLCYPGSCDAHFFNQWLEKCLIPHLEEGDVIIMDNARFHHSSKTQELIEAAKCHLLFLPSYSPDLNPIEKFWANLKRRIRSCIQKFSSFKEALYDAFRSFCY